MRVSLSWLLLALISLLGAGCRPHGWDALRQGDQLLQAGRIAEAMPLLRQAAVELPNEPRAWNCLGLANHHSGHPLEAQRAYLRALQEDRNFFDAHYNLGTLFAEQGEWIEVERSFRTFLSVEANRTQPVAWRLLGEAQWHNRNYEQAQRNLATAAKLEPKNPEVWNLLGVVEAARRHFPEARQDLAYALYLSPRYPAALLNLAILTHQHFGDKKTAAALYRDYLGVVPTAPNAEAIRALIRQLETVQGVPPPTELHRAEMPSSKSATANDVAVTNLPPAAARPLVPHPPPIITAQPRMAAPSVATNEGPKVASQIPDTAPAPPPLTSSPSILNPKAPPLPIEAPAPAPPSPGTNLSSLLPEVVRIEDEQTLGSTPPALPIGPPIDPTESATSVAQKNPPKEALIEVPASTRLARATDDGRPTEKSGFWRRINPVVWGNPARWFARTPTRDSRLEDAPEAPRPGIPPPARPVGRFELTGPRETPRYRRVYGEGISPGNRVLAETKYAIGAEAYEGGDRAGALEAYRQAVGADPTHFPSQYNLAVVALLQGDVATSLKAGEAAVQLDTLSAAAHRAFAAALIKGNYPTDAVEELEKLVLIRTDDAESHLTAAGLYANQLEDVTRARFHYQRVVSLAPNHPQASSIRSWLIDHP